MSVYSVKKKVQIITIDPIVYNLDDLCKGALMVRLRRSYWGTNKVPPLQLLSSENLTQEELDKLIQWFESFNGILWFFAKEEKP